ncbi:MAG: hypothetical protein SWH61_16370 [Thermodesulfobacteriota bacterium]|nr:hypothetical protein [Thermodesulfobacteriota bacterium]
MDRYIVRYSVFHMMQAFILQVVVFTLSLALPAWLFRWFILPMFASGSVTGLVGIVVLFCDLYFWLICAVIVSGLVWRVCRLRYLPGLYPMDSRKSRNMKKWLLTQAIYRPVHQVLVALSLYPLKMLHLRLFGAKIGRGVTIEGILLDPCLIEVGDNTMVGGYTYVFGHSFELVPGKKDFRCILAKTRIGGNCGIGSGCIVMCGGQMEDQSFLAAHSILLKNRTLETGGYYGGVPAKLITVVATPEDEALFE